MNTVLSLGLLLGALIGVGEVTYYDKNLMEQVYADRLTWDKRIQPCEECIGLVALPAAQYLGRRVYLQRPGRLPEGPYHVVDCAAQQDLPALTARNLVAEVDRVTADRWGMAGPLAGVRVYLAASTVPKEPDATTNVLPQLRGAKHDLHRQ